MNKYFPHLFSPIRVGGITVKNRVVMSAMDTGYFDINGCATPKARAHYVERARGGVGLIITEVASYEWPYGKESRREPCFNNTEATVEWAEIVQVVHSFGTKIIAQLNHAGFVARPEFNLGRQGVTAWAAGGENAVSSEYREARTLDLEEIHEFVELARRCARHVNDCGFDGIEYHCAHDYLFNQFLSPLANKRTDEYGGSLENRTRFLVECIRAAKEELDPGKIISVKIPTCEELPGGLSMEDGVEIAKMCEAAGANLIDCSVGQGPDGNATEPEWLPDGRRIHFAAAVKPHMTTAKVGVVGKLRTPELCEKAIAEGSTDMVVIGRALLADPHWAKKAQFGKSNEIRKCLSCREGCMHTVRPASGNVRCVLNPYQGFEEQVTEHLPGKADQPKKILIVGGGIAGMQAAIIAKKRGHEVKLVEKKDHLGGQMVLAGIPPFKNAIVDAKNWFIEEMERLGVDVTLGVNVDTEYILAQAPEVVLLAIGSEPSRPPVPGIELCEDGWKILEDVDNMPEDKEIVIIGGGTVGCEIAHTLIEKGNHITIIEMDDGLSKKQNVVHRQRNQKILDDAETVICLKSMVQKVEEGKVTYKDEQGELHEVICDLSVCATGQRPLSPDWAMDLICEGIDAFTLGDATATGDFRSATRSAMDVVMSL